MIAYQKATIDQALEIKKLLKLSWDNTYISHYPQEVIDIITSQWHSLKIIEKQILDPKLLFLVVLDDKKLIAMCNTSYVSREIVNIERLHVLTGYQGMGIGTNLINKVIEYFPEAKKLQIEVEIHNYKAKAFYEKKGFKKIGDIVFEFSGYKMPSDILELNLN